MTVATDAKALVSDVESFLITVEGRWGHQSRLRHWLHGAQSELEKVIGVPDGSLTPNGGIPKDPLADESLPDDVPSPSAS